MFTRKNKTYCKKSLDENKEKIETKRWVLILFLKNVFCFCSPESLQKAVPKLRASLDE